MYNLIWRRYFRSHQDSTGTTPLLLIRSLSSPWVVRRHSGLHMPQSNTLSMLCRQAGMGLVSCYIPIEVHPVFRIRTYNPSRLDLLFLIDEIELPHAHLVVVWFYGFSWLSWLTHSYYSQLVEGTVKIFCSNYASDSFIPIVSYVPECSATAELQVYFNCFIYTWMFGSRWTSGLLPLNDSSADQ